MRVFGESLQFGENDGDVFDPFGDLALTDADALRHSLRHDVFEQPLVLGGRLLEQARLLLHAVDQFAERAREVAEFVARFGGERHVRLAGARESARARSGR